MTAKKQPTEDPIAVDVTTFGRMPFTVGRRQVGITESGEPIWGPLERQGSLATWDKPVTAKPKTKGGS
jgi:hypothetical protein